MKARARRRIAPLRVVVVPPRPSVLDRVHPLIAMAGAIIVSATAHSLGLAAAARVHLRERAPMRRDEVRVTVVDKPPPKPPDEPKPEPIPITRAVRPKIRAPVPKETPPPPVEAPPPPVEEAPAETPKPVLITGLGLSSTSASGSFAVGVGNTLAGTRSDRAPAPGEARPYKAKEYAAPYALTEEPVFLDNVSPAQVRGFYPEEARKAKVEGAVVVKLTVDDDGTVVRVKIVSDPGHGFGAAAVRLARLYRFKPAKVDGRKVATEIPFTIHFEVE